MHFYNSFIENNEINVIPVSFFFFTCIEKFVELLLFNVKSLSLLPQHNLFDLK